MALRLSAVMFLAIFVTFVVLETSVSAKSFPRNSRALVEDKSSTKKTCFTSAPCGWAIYVPFTREIVDYMPNTCKCPDNLKCLRTDDDLSVSAYIHRCREPSQNSDPDNLQHVFS